MKYINIRGCNGSGKTTLLQTLGKQLNGCVIPVSTSHEIKRKGGSQKDWEFHPAIPVTYCFGDFDGLIAILGDYAPAAAGATPTECDQINSRQAIKLALKRIVANPNVRFILFESPVVSSLYYPWKNQAKAHRGMAWAFLDTPLDICLRRIQARNGDKPVNEAQIAEEYRIINRVREKAVEDGLKVLNLDHTKPLADLLDYLNISLEKKKELTVITPVLSAKIG